MVFGFVSGLSQRTDSEAYLTERSQRAMFPWIPCKRGSSPLAKGKDGLCCPGALVLNLFTPHHVFTRQETITIKSDPFRA